MRYFILVALLLLAGCLPGAEQTLRLHEIELVGGDSPFRYSYFYGAPGEVTSGERRLVLSDGPSEDPLAVPGALLVNGRPNRAQEMRPLSPQPSEVQRAAMSTDMLVRTAGATGAVVYYDGRLWFDLLDSAEAGFDTRVVPRPRVDGLRGLGRLSPAEAEMLERVLEPRGAVVLTVLLEPLTPPQVYAGAQIDEYLRTSLAVQTGVPVDPAAVQPAVQDLRWDELASGQQATLGAEVGAQADYRVVTSQDALLTLWNRAHGAQLSPPRLPELDFRRESVIAVFLGQRPSGGYGVSVRDLRLEGGDVILLLEERQPGPGDITTQALTSPWLMLRVARPNLRAAWIRDAQTGNLIGVAQPLN